MKLDLSEIARIPGSYAEHEINMTLRELEGLTLTAPIRGKLIASSTGRVLLLEGYVDTEVETVCSRCGITFHEPVHAEFQEDFIVHNIAGQGQVGGPLVEEDIDVPDSRLFFPGTLDLNLDELLRQSILVALPIKSLCDEKCKGLCPHCGNNLNEGPCTCPPETGHPELAKLRTILEARGRSQAKES